MGFNLSWLKAIEQIAPVILAVTPLAPIAPFVAGGIQIAEQIPGASGATKLDLAKQITHLAVAATNAQAGSQKLDPEAVRTALDAGIATVVAAANIAAKPAAPKG